MAGSALKGSDPALEEAARAVGLGPIDAFRRVTLPLLRPSLLAGALLVFLYALSDFGAVSLLRVNTFTTEIFHQLNTRFDQRNAAVLSAMLVLITAMVLMAQRGSLGAAALSRGEAVSGHPPFTPSDGGKFRPSAAPTSCSAARYFCRLHCCSTKPAHR